MNLTRYEMETQINFNEEEKTATVYTFNNALKRKLEKFAEERPEECRLIRTSCEGRAADYEIPKSWVKIVPKRILTEKQKAAVRDNVAKALLSKKMSCCQNDSVT